MNEVRELGLALAGGLAIGAVFGALLWLNLRTLGARRHPGAWLLAGGAARLVLVLIALHLLTAWQPLPVVCALAGFVLARVVVVRAVAAGAARGRERPA